MDFLLKSEKENNALAQWFLGYLYEHKLNDKNKALKYYALAGENGMIFAMEKVGIIYYQGEFVERNLQFC